MDINEIFYSIQGEGSWTGIPNIFIRTAGCNLRCTYCDTKYAYYEKKNMTIKEIIEVISKYKCKNICITGGEPLLQEETIKLIDTLIKNNYKICLETNGSIDIKNISNKKYLIISLDIKCPSSKMHKKMHLENISYLDPKDQIKFIISNKEDYHYAKNMILNKNIKCNIYFQPVEGLAPKKLADWILNDELNIRLGLQIQKIIWNKKRGV